MFPHFHLASCPSTQDETIKFLEIHQENLAVYTFNQTKGRGQYGNTWEAPSNLNIAYSLGLKTSYFKVSNSLFNFHTANVLRRFLANLTNRVVETKWPNDIIMNQKKIVGLLIEKRKIENEEYYIIGIGINVLQQNFDGLNKAGSLLTQTDKRFELEAFAGSLHMFLSNEVLKCPDGDQILGEINANLFRRNKVSVFEIKGVRQNGIIKNVDASGFLWIDLENTGLQKFYHKEIDLLY